MAGIQFLVLKWSSYDFTIFQKYNYVRIKMGFILLDTDKYVVILARSDDDNIGVVVLIPSIVYKIGRAHV